MSIEPINANNADNEMTIWHDYEFSENWGNIIDDVDFCTNVQTIINGESNQVYCIKCNICNIFIDVTHEKCFRCKTILNHNGTMILKSITKCVQPKDLHWICLVCKFKNTNIKTNFCVNGDCCYKQFHPLALDFPYKPSIKELTKDQSTISLFKNDTYKVYQRVCTQCGDRNDHIICNVCGKLRTIKIITNKLGILLLAYQSISNCHIFYMIVKYFTGYNVCNYNVYS